jgi:hypothetical protein
MQITLNIPDDLPTAIVQQYIKTIETQMALMRKLTINPNNKLLTFIAEDFNSPLEEFKPTMQSIWLGIDEWRKTAQFDEINEELTDEMIASWRDKSSGRDFSWGS